MICRVCLQETGSPLSIFDGNEEKSDIADILQQHLWFRPSPEDAVSTVICSECWYEVNGFHKFYLSVEQAHLAFFSGSLGAAGDVERPQTFSKQSTWHKVVDENAESFPSEKVETIYPLKKIKLEYESDSTTFESGPTAVELGPTTMVSAPATVESSSLTNNEIEQIKIKEEEKDEATLAEEVWQGTDNTLPIEEVETQVQIKEESLENAWPEELSEETDNFLIEIDIGNIEANQGITDGESQYQEEYNYKQPISRRSTTPAQDEKVVRKYIHMKCDLCAFVGRDFIGMRRHFRSKHGNLRPYVKCCNQKITTRYHLIEHAYKHEDPEVFKCTECDKVFSYSSTLRTHIRSLHIRKSPEYVYYIEDESVSDNCDVNSQTLNVQIRQRSPTASTHQ